MKRGVKFVLVFVGLAVVLSLGGVAVMFLAVSRGPTVPAAATLVLRPGGEIQEIVPDDVFGLLGRDTNTVRGFVEGLEKAKRDPRIKAVLLMPSSLLAAVLGQGAGTARRGARLQEVAQDRHRLSRVRRRSRVLPGQRRRQGVSAADEPARPDRRRVLRDLPARDARQDRRRIRTSCTSASTRRP